MGLATDEIKARLNIVDLIGEYVQLQKAGAGWKARCPFHNEKTPSFSVNEEKQFWHCFGCGKGGDSFAFLMEIEGLEFREALEKLAERTGVDLSKYRESGFKPGGDDKKILREILEWSSKFYQKQLWDGVGKEKILKYLRERGLNDETIKEFGLGYAPSGWRNLLNFLLQRDYKVEDILKTGLIIQKNNDGKSQNTSDYYDRFRDRILFPICGLTGETLGYSGRVAPGGDESQAKYINTPETIVYHKGKVLYGIDKAKNAIKEQDSVLLVEGNMDVIASYQSGFKNTVAVSGTALTPEQLGIIKRYTKNIKLCFDMDEAGQKASKRSAELAFQNEMNVYIVEIKGAKDAADALRDDRESFLRATKEALPALEYFLEKEIAKRNKNNIEDKKSIIEELTPLINSFAGKIEREYWIREMASRLDVSEESLKETFDKVKAREEARIYGRNQNFSQQQKVSDNIEMGQKTDRLEKLQTELLGLLIVDEEVWKKIFEKIKEQAKYFLPNDKIRNIIVKKGAESDFQFEKLMEILDDEKEKAFLRELYLKQKERIEDLSEREKMEELEQCVTNLEEELKKRKRVELARQIKEAENAGNKELVEKLAKEMMGLV